MAKYDKPVAVLGAGNGGHCMAADLTLQGFKVNLYELPEFAEKFELVRKTKRIELHGAGKDGTAKLHLATHDLAEAVSEAEIINLTAPAFAHETFFSKMLPQLRDNHLVVIWAGNFGSLRLAKILREQKNKHRPLIAEVNTLPYGTRLQGPGKVAVSLLAPSLFVSTMPAKNTGAALKILRNIYPQAQAADNVLAAALSNPNPVVHPPASLLNTGRIQYSGGTFCLYIEGITEAVARVIRQLYRENETLAEKLGFEIIRYREADFQTTSSIMGVAFQAEFDTQGVIGRNFPGPKSIYDRYITEDVPCGLVPLSLLGKKYGVKTPIADSMINIACSVCSQDYWQTGRNLEMLGIDNLSQPELLRYLQSGQR